MGRHRPGHDFVELQTVQLMAVDQALQRRRQHVEVGLFGIDAVGAAERDSAAADDGDPA